MGRPRRSRILGPAAEEVDRPESRRQLFAAYGENRLGVHNIGLGSGTVSVRGSGVAPDQEVWVAGRPMPVDESGSFVTEEILPEGAHTVEVAVLDTEGSGELYLRDLEFKNNDWFYVGMADLTVSENTASGPIDLLQGGNSDFDYDSNIDGRLAFFVNGKFGDHWKLTASADTREGPLDDLFSNFMDKSPDALFRRIDPDYYYPTFGDDATVEEMAPTMGKFFVRLGKDDDFGQWGNFKVGYMNNELAQVDRGLYGANLHYQSDATTEFGDRRLVVDGFAAEPGTVASREEFRGTGGSLYFLQRQDILAGSERVRIEMRDKASGIVTGVRQPDAGAWTTTSTTCRVASCSPSRWRRLPTTTCWCAAARYPATRPTWSCVTSTRRVSTTSMRWRLAARRTTGSAITSSSA